MWIVWGHFCSAILLFWLSFVCLFLGRYLPVYFPSTLFRFLQSLKLSARMYLSHDHSVFKRIYFKPVPQTGNPFTVNSHHSWIVPKKRENSDIAFVFASNLYRICVLCCHFFFFFILLHVIQWLCLIELFACVGACCVFCINGFGRTGFRGFVVSSGNLATLAIYHCQAHCSKVGLLFFVFSLTFLQKKSTA